MSLSLGQVVSMEVLLRPVTPYLLPGLLALPLIVTLARRLPAVTEETRRNQLRTVLAIISSYFLLNLPYAINLLVQYGLQLSQQKHRSACNPLSHFSRYSH
jgi:ABC-type Fe3+ transport system permease subunit